MAPRGPPFDFDLNEPPPPENDGVKGIPAAPVPEPSVQQDPLPPEPVPEPTTAHVPLTARSLAPAPDEPLPAPPQAPVPVPSPSPLHHLPSPVLDLEAPLSSLDDEDEDEADLPLPPPPPLHLPPPPPLPPSYRVADASDALTVSSCRHGDAARPYSSPETWAPRGSRAAASDTTSSHGSRRRPYSCDDAISKQRRVDDYEEDGGGSSSRSGTRRSEFGSPRRYERSGGPAPPRRLYYGQDGGRHAPAAGGQPGAPARNRRSRRRGQRPQHGYHHQYEGPVQKRQGRGREQQQGFLGQEKPRVHYVPGGPELPKVGYVSSNPLSASFVRRGSSGARLSPEQEPGNGWYHRPGCREREAPPPFRPSSRPRGRQSHQVQEPPEIGGYHHREREAPSFRPSSSGAHGGREDGSSGRRHIPEEKPITGGGHHHQQTKAPPRGGRDEHFPDRAYHPYARRGSGFDRPLDGGRNPARREPRDSYEHRRYSKELLRSGTGPARGRQYYGDAQE